MSPTARLFVASYAIGLVVVWPALHALHFGLAIAAVLMEGKL